MLQSQLKHIMSKDEHSKFISENKNAVVVCGRNGPMCLPVYGVMKALEPKFENIAFSDFEFDNPDAAVIRNLPEAQNFRGLPFTIYYQDGKVVKATSSIQSAKDVKSILKEVYA
ncbi:thioredoxin [Candidatus Lokiarchaeum ossiferum]